MTAGRWLAIILMVGNLVNREGEDIRPGDVVMYMKYAGLPVVVEGSSCRILMCNDIICVRDDSESRTDTGVAGQA